MRKLITRRDEGLYFRHHPGGQGSAGDEARLNHAAGHLLNVGRSDLSGEQPDDTLGEGVDRRKDLPVGCHRGQGGTQSDESGQDRSS